MPSTSTEDDFSGQYLYHPAAGAATVCVVSTYECQSSQSFSAVSDIPCTPTSAGSDFRDHDHSAARDNQLTTKSAEGLEYVELKKQLADVHEPARKSPKGQWDH